MHVLIFEPCTGGHRFTYVRRIIDALSELPVRLTLATSPGATGAPAFSEQLSRLAARFGVDESFPEAPEKSKVGAAWHASGDLVRAVREHRPDHVIVPSCDGVLEMVGARRLGLGARGMNAAELEAMMIGGTWVYKKHGSPGRWAKRRAWAALTGASGVRTLHTIDPVLMRAFRALTPRIARRVVLAPDPVESMPGVSKAEARRRLGIGEGGRVVSTIGRMDERKGADLLIRAFVRASAPEDRLVLVGTQMPVVRELLNGEAQALVRAGRIWTIDGYASDEQMSLAIAASDLVGVTYRRDIGSASVLIRAAAQGRPVLTSDGGWLGETCRRFGLGTTCRVQDLDALGAAMKAAIEQAPGFVPSPASERFVRFHTVENAARFWARRLRERLNLPDPAPVKTWDWVLERALPLAGGEPAP